jgi:hypothetical protein
MEIIWPDAYKPEKSRSVSGAERYIAKERKYSLVSLWKSIQNRVANAKLKKDKERP